jgi:hypothetical protein
MQSTFSIAVMICASAAMVLAILGLNACKTVSEEVKTRVGAINAGYVAGWSAPDGLRNNVNFGLPRIPRPRLPHPRLPRPASPWPGR